MGEEEPEAGEMKTFVFNSQFNTGAELPEASQDEIKNEPMLFRCNGEHAMEFGGKLTRQFLSALPESWKSDALLIDSRTHMLMPGWYPCIPGWHHDDVPRERVDGQPEYSNPSYHAEHIMALWGNASLTEFATGRATFEDVPVGRVYYRESGASSFGPLAAIQRSQGTKCAINRRFT